jgi:hypothetical protein
LIIDITEPCNFSKIFSPNKVNWLPSQHDYSNLNYKRISCFTNETRSDCAYENIKKQEEDLIYFSGTDHGSDIFFENFRQNSLLDMDIMSLGVVKRVQDFTLKHLIRTWYRDLFRLETSLETKYQHIKQQAYSNHENMKLYCAQIRIGGQRPDVPYDAYFNPRNITKLFWQFIRDNFIENADWKLFVTSDLEEVEMEAISEFGVDRVVRIDGINSHVGREKQSNNDCTRIEKPILDFHFLQNCDKAVISNSGFGQFATWNRENPDKDLFVLGTNWRQFDPEWTFRIKKIRKQLNDNKF